MLDTVILNIPKDQYRLLSWDRFILAGAKRGRNGVSIYQKFVNNATKEEEEAGMYRPQVTIYQRATGAFLKVQFSAQKILFGNSLEELDEDRFEDVLGALWQALRDMDVVVEKETLKHGKVMSFHPAKNIPINDGYSVQGIIKDFSKINLTEKMDLNDTKFRNNGDSLQFRAKSHTLTFYNKISDLKKNEKNAYDKDQKAQQLSLFDFMQQKKLPEVLRMEVRLSEKPKMNSVLKKLGYVKNPSFADIFKRDIWQKVLLDYFQIYIEPNYFIFDLQDDPQTILQSILRKKPKMKIARAMSLAALKVFCKADGGTRGLRKIIEPRAGRRKWQRIAKEIKTLNRRIPLKSCYGYIKQIKQELQKFKPYQPKIGQKLST